MYWLFSSSLSLLSIHCFKLPEVAAEDFETGAATVLELAVSVRLFALSPRRKLPSCGGKALSAVHLKLVAVCGRLFVCGCTDVTGVKGVDDATAAR
jgi:hypothetical protein